MAAVVVLFCFTGCGKRDDTNVYTVAVYMEENGISQEQKLTEKFDQFNATTIMTFLYDNEVVRILEFKTPEDAQNSEYKNYYEDTAINVNGRFLLHSANERVIEVFKGFDAK